MAGAEHGRHAAPVEAKHTRRDRPRAMRIDRTRCLNGGACRIVAPEIDDTERIAITSATLDAMAACPSGALTWVEDDRPGDDPVSGRATNDPPPRR